jgi:homoserine dehydrogenase
LNGTTNHILTEAQETGTSPQAALKAAQEAGFAESDPSSDLSGDDSRYKLTILLAHAFGTVVSPRSILRHGITDLQPIDLTYGQERGWTLRLIATAYRSGDRLIAYVLPRFVRADEAFALVRREYNAVRIEGARSGTHTLQGKGAGRLPTGLAVLSDVHALARGGGYGYAKVNAAAPRLSLGQEAIEVYAQIPATHQEVLAQFITAEVIGTTPEHIRVNGRITLEGLAQVLGEGREGFQVIALPHLRALN